MTIKIKVSVGYDLRHKEQTEIGVLFGKGMVESLALTEQEATELIQATVDELSYEEGQEFVKRYKK